MSQFDITYLAAAGGGLVSFLSPCVLPLVPAYLCFLTGATLDELSAGGGANSALRRHVVLSALAFVLGFSSVFMSLGASASAVNALLIHHMEGLAQIAGVVIILFGLHFMGLFRIAAFNRQFRFDPIGRPPGWFGAYLIGLAFGFGWTPCIGPILAAILAVAASRETLGDGVALLGAYSAGLGVPFLLAALGVPVFLGFTARMGAHMRKLELATGGLLVVTGALFLSGTFQTFSYILLEAFPVLGEIG